MPRYIVTLDPGKRGNAPNPHWNPGRFYSHGEAVEKAKEFAREHLSSRFLVCRVSGSAEAVAVEYREEME